VGTEALALNIRLYRVRVVFSPPGWRRALLLIGKGGELPESSVTEIHAYPCRPPGFEEPLFQTGESKREIMTHLLEATWLRRASELPHGVGESAHAAREPVRLLGVRGRVDLVRPERYRRGPVRQRVVRVLERWREVRAWWDEEIRTDRFVFRVLLAGGVVAELALERPGGWFLVGMAD
jgi:hypothetical protein